MDRLQDEMTRIRKQIEEERQGNVRRQEDERRAVEARMKDFQRREDDFRQQKEKMLFDLSELAGDIKEANQICALMEKRVLFKQCYLRSMRAVGDSDEPEVEEVLQVRVTNEESGTVVIWDVTQFQERLQVLRDTLGVWEEKRERKEERRKERELAQ